MNGKTGNLGDVVHIERFKDKTTVISERQFSKRYLKYLTNKYLTKNNQCVVGCAWLRMTRRPTSCDISRSVTRMNCVKLRNEHELLYRGVASLDQRSVQINPSAYEKKMTLIDGWSDSVHVIFMRVHA